jgi:hypothetical protein
MVYFVMMLAIQFSLKWFITLILITGIFFAIISGLVRYSKTWSEAERAEALLSQLYGDVYNVNTDGITTEMLDQYLEKQEYKYLKKIRNYEIELRQDEVAWFSPNKKFSISLKKNGVKTWIVNGKRYTE